MGLLAFVACEGGDLAGGPDGDADTDADADGNGDADSDSDGDLGVCDGVTCSGHGRCFDVGTEAVCVCDEDYRAVGLTCVPVEADGDADADSDSEPDGDTDVDEADADPDGCGYPAAPYAFERGGTLAPMSWPEAVAGVDTVGEADLAAMHCDPEVNSIFLLVSTMSCPTCPDKLNEIRDLRAHWETHGARWIFILADAIPVAQAGEYVDRHGVTFGWRTNDLDNSEGVNTIVFSPIIEIVPWIGVIRASDMQLVYDEPDETELDIEAIAIELASSD